MFVPGLNMDHHHHVISEGGYLIMEEEEGHFGVHCNSPTINIMTSTEHEDNSGGGSGNDFDADLFVFGYMCKIFRDDERAKWIDKHEHLIPWMGNPELLIDRYDCRGALMDISRYESGGSTSRVKDSSENNFDEVLNEEVSEELLDEERYRDLNEDDDYDDGAFDRATDFKKLQSAMDGMVSETDSKQYASLGYDYNEQNHEICMGPEPKPLHDEDAPFVKPSGLHIPEEIVVPTKMKVHAIIEKTAKFIASQGSQMEIILKTKQATNPLFDFLSHGGILNPYYKFLVNAIRNGYRPPDNEISSPENDGGEDADGYLHPSLFRTTTVNTSLPSVTPRIEPLSSTTSKHNSYSMLVSRIKGTESPVLENDKSNSITTTTRLPQLVAPTVATTTAYTTSRPKNQLPSTQDQLIIEKMASYVIKNGTSFEALAKNKSDPRFGFLQPSHKYHWYYLNCKERFKAECNAVVASSDFVTYGGGASSSAASRNSNVNKISSTTTLPPVKKLLMQGKKVSQAVAPVASSSAINSVPTENVFSQMNLVSNKEKDKPMIRFSSSLRLNTPSVITSSKVDAPSSTQSKPVVINKPLSVVIEERKYSENKRGDASEKTSVVKTEITISDNDKEDGEVDDDSTSNSDICILHEDIRPRNASPISEDEEVKKRRRMERKRKAMLFLQKLKMSKNTDENMQNEQNKEVPASTSTTGSSLGDLLLTRRLQGDGVEEEKSSNSMSSPESSSRRRSKPYKTSSSSSKHKKRRRRSRSYSSTPSSYSSSDSHDSSDYGSYSKKKSSKRKRKKKKKKHEKSRSSHKSSRR